MTIPPSYRWYVVAHIVGAALVVKCFYGCAHGVDTPPTQFDAVSEVTPEAGIDAGQDAPFVGQDAQPFNGGCNGIGCGGGGGTGGYGGGLR